jgi:hypothetical protein
VPSPKESGKVWELEEGVTCVVCPDCAFTFDAVHENDEPEGTYSCPLCAELSFRAAIEVAARDDCGPKTTKRILRRALAGPE